MTRPRVAVLGSGRGSNYLALQAAVNAGTLPVVLALVVSDVAGAPILAHAHRFGVPAVVLAPSPFKTRLSPEGEGALVELLRAHAIEWVVLAGYMRVVKEPLLSAFARRIINIHPSLLPLFKGLRAWEQALAAGVPETGCTVHRVSADIDGGEILAQARVPVQPGDTPATLHARIQEAEHRLYPATLAQIVRDSPG